MSSSIIELLLIYFHLNAGTQYRGSPAGAGQAPSDFGRGGATGRVGCDRGRALLGMGNTSTLQSSYTHRTKSQVLLLSDELGLDELTSLECVLAAYDELGEVSAEAGAGVFFEERRAQLASLHRLLQLQAPVV